LWHLFLVIFSGDDDHRVRQIYIEGGYSFL
jgi:hypothetical protein